MSVFGAKSIGFKASFSSLDRHHLSQQDLLPGVKLADSATLFLASKASEGYLIINQ